LKRSMKSATEAPEPVPLSVPKSKSRIVSEGVSIGTMGESAEVTETRKNRWFQADDERAGDLTDVPCPSATGRPTSITIWISRSFGRDLVGHARRGPTANVPHGRWNGSAGKPDSSTSDSASPRSSSKLIRSCQGSRDMAEGWPGCSRESWSIRSTAWLSAPRASSEWPCLMKGHCEEGWAQQSCHQPPLGCRPSHFLHFACRMPQ
jgi:hypothetical protein